MESKKQFFFFTQCDHIRKGPRSRKDFQVRILKWGQNFHRERRLGTFNQPSLRCSPSSTDWLIIIWASITSYKMVWRAVWTMWNLYLEYKLPLRLHLFLPKHDISRVIPISWDYLFNSVIVRVRDISMLL